MVEYVSGRVYVMVECKFCGVCDILVNVSIHVSCSDKAEGLIIGVRCCSSAETILSRLLIGGCLTWVLG